MCVYNCHCHERWCNRLAVAAQPRVEWQNEIAHATWMVMNFMCCEASCLSDVISMVLFYSSFAKEKQTKHDHYSPPKMICIPIKFYRPKIKWRCGERDLKTRCYLSLFITFNMANEYIKYNLMCVDSCVLKLFKQIFLLFRSTHIAHFSASCKYDINFRICSASIPNRRNSAKFVNRQKKNWALSSDLEYLMDILSTPNKFKCTHHFGEYISFY